MNCPNCGTPINDGNTVCPNCGTPTGNMPQNSQMNNQMNHMMSSGENQTGGTGYSNEDALVCAYVGKNVEKIKENKFSWPVLFGGMFYFLYRKLYLYGYLYAIVLGCASSIHTFLGLAVQIFVAFKFNGFYLNEVKNRVQKIKTKSPNASQAELEAKCRKSGGVNVGIVVFYLVLFLILIFLTIFMAFVTLDLEKSGKNKDRVKSHNNQVVENLSFTLPDGYQVEKDGSSLNARIDEDGHSCAVIISYGPTVGNESPKEILEEYIEMYKDLPNTKNSKILKAWKNGHEWYTTTVTTNYESYVDTAYTWAANYNGMDYVVSVVTDQDSKSACEEDRNTIVNSLVLD